MTLHSAIHQCFGPEGWLVQAKGYRYEPAQLAYALDVGNWLTGDADAPLALVEGDTGVGKSLGYAVPLLLVLSGTPQRGVIATHTVQLQRQLLQGDLITAAEYLQSLGRIPVVTQQLIGRQHFIDALRTEAAIRALLEEGAVIPHAEQLIEGAKRCASSDGLIDTFRQDYGPLPDGLSDDVMCITDNSDSVAAAQYTHQRERAQAAQLVVTSHTMCLLNRRRADNGIFETPGNPVNYLIVDEADLLRHSGTISASLRRRPLQLAEPFVALQPLLTTRKLKASTRSMLEMARSLDESLRAFDLPRTEPTPVLFQHDKPSDIETVVENAMNSLAALVRPVMKAVAKKNIEDHHLASSLAAAREANFFITRYLNRQEQLDQIWGIAWSQARRNPVLEALTLFPAKAIRRYWANPLLPPVRTLFTSATLSNGSAGKFTSFKNEIRTLDHGRFCVEAIHSPATFGRLDFVLPDTTVPRPVSVLDDDTVSFDPCWLRYCASMINAAAQKGNTLVLTTSYLETQALAAHLSDARCHIHQQGTPLSQLLRTFRDMGGVLVTPAMWQGISIRSASSGQHVTQLVVTRIPFSPPNPMRDSAMTRHLTRAGLSRAEAEGIATGWRTIGVARRLRQGLGRLIRHADDQGTIWIGDPRFPSPHASGAQDFSAFVSAIAPRFQAAYRAAPIFNLDSRLSHADTASPDLMEWL